MFLIDETVSSRDVVLMTVEKLGISEGSEKEILPYFALYQSPDGKRIGRALQPEQKVTLVVNGWEKDSSAKLVFAIRLCTPRTLGIEMRDRVAVRLSKPQDFLSKEVYYEAAQVVDEALLRVQYINSIYHVLTGVINVSYTQALKLAGYQFMVKFGNYKPSIHKVGFLGPKIVELMPLRLLKNKGFEESEADLFEYIKDTTQYEYLEGHSEAQKKYMDVVWMLDNFGKTFFRCTQNGLKDSVHEKVLLAVHPMGVELYDRSIERKRICGWSLGEIMTWEYNEDEQLFTLLLPKSALDASNSLLTNASGGKLEFTLEDPVDSVNRSADEAAKAKRGSVLGNLGRRASAIIGGAGGEKADQEDEGRPRNISLVAMGAAKPLVRDVADLLTDYVAAFQLEQAAMRARCSEDTIDYSVPPSSEYHHGGGSIGVGESKTEVSRGHSTITNIMAPEGHVPHMTPREELAAMKKANAERMDLGNDEETRSMRAAVRLQAFVRGFLLRNEWYREDCAILIQSVWRGYTARALASDMIEVMLLEQEELSSDEGSEGDEDEDEDEDEDDEEDEEEEN